MPWRVLALQVKTAIESECAGSEVTAFKVDVTNRAEVRETSCWVCAGTIHDTRCAGACGGQMKAFVAHAEATFGAGVDIMVNNGT